MNGEEREKDGDEYGGEEETIKSNSDAIDATDATHAIISHLIFPPHFFLRRRGGGGGGRGDWECVPLPPFSNIYLFLICGECIKSRGEMLLR